MPPRFIFAKVPSYFLSQGIRGGRKRKNQCVLDHGYGGNVYGSSPEGEDSIVQEECRYGNVA